MDVILQILISGLTLGSTYALAALGLALIWGAMGMLNMAHGALLTIGGYASFSAVSLLGLSWFWGLPAAILAGGLAGLVLFAIVVLPLARRENFELNIIVATIGVALLVESLLIDVYSAYPAAQPFSLQGGAAVLGVQLPNNTLLILVSSLLIMAAFVLLLSRTDLGRAIRATAQNPTAAQLVGVKVTQVYAAVMILAGVVAGVSGVLVTSISSLSPTAGYEPMLKAFIICAVAGLGSMPGTVVMAFVLGMVEAAVQYAFGARFGFPALLAVVVLILIVRPSGLFGSRKAVRL